MGAESFFILFVDSESEKKLNYEGEYQFAGAVKLKIQDFVSVADFNCKLLVPTIFEDSGFFQGISFEGCFSCYEKCLEELEIIFHKYLFKIDTLMIFDSKENRKINFKNFDDVREKIQKSNEKKFKRYNEIFHGFRKECLPNAQFYKRYKNRKADKLISWLKSIFGGNRFGKQ